MDYSVYQDHIVSQINEVTGLQLVWEDFQLTNPIPIDGKTIEVTISPTPQGSVKFKGEARFKIDRMVLDNEEFVFAWETLTSNIQQAVQKFGADLAFHDKSPTTLSEVLTLISESTGLPFLPSDFENITVTPSATEDVIFTLVSKATSMYFFGTLAIRLTHPWVNRILFTADLPNPTRVSASVVANGILTVDGEVVKLPDTIPAGKHEILVTNFDSTAGWVTFLKPVHLKALRLYYGTYNNLFLKATTLTTIDDSCIKIGGATTVVDGLFNGCTNLTKLPDSVFAPNSTASAITAMFASTGIEYLGENTFKNLSLVGGTLNSIFTACLNLKRVHPRALKPLGKEITYSVNLFSGTPLSEIPTGLFDSFTKMTNLSTPFLDCKEITNIPQGLFKYMTELTTMTNVFRGCSGLVMVPEDLLSTLTVLGTCNGLFYGCSSLQSIPELLLANNPRLVQLNDFVAHTLLHSIPLRLFEKQTMLVHLNNSFASTKITAIPPTLFKYCRALGVVTQCFEYCRSLDYLPPELFSGQNNLSQVVRTFRGTGIKNGVPSNFFPGTGIRDSSGVFRDTKIESIGEGLFAAHTRMVSAAYAFAGTPIKTVPPRVYVVTDGGQDYSGLFAGCSELVSVQAKAIRIIFGRTNCIIPELFKDCTKLTTLENEAVTLEGLCVNFMSFMENCSALKISDVELFKRIVFKNLAPANTRINFVNMFRNCFWITGKCMTLFNGVSAGTPMSGYYTNQNFCERCWLLDDYELVKQPWWTTPIDLSLLEGKLSVFKMNDVQVAGDDYIPYYATWYANADRNLMSGLYDTNNEPITGARLERLERLFFSLGLEVPEDAKTHSLRTLTRSSTIMTENVRPEIRLLTMIVFNREMPAINVAITDPQTYMICSTRT